MPFTPGTVPPTMEPTAAVLAADAAVLRYGVSEDGAIALAVAFWLAVRRDAAFGGRAIREWLLTDEFVEWAGVCGVKSEDARDTILNQ